MKEEIEACINEVGAAHTAETILIRKAGESNDYSILSSNLIVGVWLIVNETRVHNAQAHDIAGMHAKNYDTVSCWQRFMNLNISRVKREDGFSFREEEFPWGSYRPVVLELHLFDIANLSEVVELLRDFLRAIESPHGLQSLKELVDFFRWKLHVAHLSRHPMLDDGAGCAMEHIIRVGMWTDYLNCS